MAARLAHHEGVFRPVGWRCAFCRGANQTRSDRRAQTVRLKRIYFRFEHRGCLFLVSPQALLPYYGNITVSSIYVNIHVSRRREGDFQPRFQRDAPFCARSAEAPADAIRWIK
ncbi:hypothetical protein [Aminobacter sp. Piv2-1]|uniref:hypothetical protein n=1 Tax=Aminobacter sp. Piv2-1 TaxID=3031122 RepID=UPI00309BBF1C